MSNRRIELRAMVHVFPERAIRVIGDALASTGSLLLAAKVLGMNRKTLRRYRRQLGSEKVWKAAIERMRGA
jgi:hypothetical protein